MTNFTISAAVVSNVRVRVLWIIMLVKSKSKMFFFINEMSSPVPLHPPLYELVEICLRT